MKRPDLWTHRGQNIRNISGTLADIRIFAFEYHLAMLAFYYNIILAEDLLLIPQQSRREFQTWITKYI